MAVKANQAQKETTGSVNQWLWRRLGQCMAAVYHVYGLYTYLGPARASLQGLAEELLIPRS